MRSSSPQARSVRSSPAREPSKVARDDLEAFLERLQTTTSIEELQPLAHELRDLGHQVEVLSGPPYPELDDDVPLHKLESMDLYRPERAFRPHRLPRTRDDWVELGVMSTGSFCEPLAFSRRAERFMRSHGHRFDVIHDQGSSHGLTRIIRLAYYEHPSYVPLLRRSYELWHELETGFGEQLLSITGSIDATRISDSTTTAPVATARTNTAVRTFHNPATGTAPGSTANSDRWVLRLNQSEAR